MYRLAILFSYIFVVFGKESSLSDFWYIDYLTTVNDGPQDEYFELSGVENDGSLWVIDLDVDSLDTLKLRAGTEEENEDFESAIGPLIDIFESRHNRKRQLSQGVTNPETVKNDSDVKNEIMRIVNKFVLSAHAEPDTLITETFDENSPSLSLHFKGPYTSLILKFGRNQWHYFVAPPSPLPKWFYEERDNVIYNKKTTYVEVPEDVQEKFYVGLLKLLGTFLRITV